MRRVGLLLWPAGAVLGLVAVWVAYGWAKPLQWIPDLAVGWAFMACGLVAAARRPDSRSGALMVATGFAWFLGNFSSAAVGPLAWLAGNGIYLHRGILVHLLLAYPSGRLSSRPARMAVGVGYVAALVAPVWDSETATIALSLLLIAAAAREYRRAVGQHRRARLVSVGAAAGLGLVLAVGAVARLTLPAGDVSIPALIAYQAMLCTIAGGLLVGLIWAPWQRADITDLVVELGAARSGSLPGALARALGDPSLEVGYWYAEAEAFVDSEGRALSLPDPATDRSVTFVERDGAPIAAIVHDPAVLDDPGLVEGVASAARLAASNARLQADVQARVVDLAASRRRLLEARDEERRRLEHRLHEGAEHRLEKLRETLRRAQHAASGAATNERLVHAHDQLVRTLEELRRLAQGLHPRILSERGLESALAALAEGAPARVKLQITSDGMSPALESATYFLCAEALANVTKHASASTVTVSVTADNAGATVVVEDDGVGGADPARGSGLRGMADRIGTLGGGFRVESIPGRGTRLTAEIPAGGEAR